MLRKIFTSTAIILTSLSPLLSQDSTASKKGNLTISGSADAYYRFNFDNARDSGYTNNYTSFTNSQNSFELGMASVKADYAVGNVDALLDLGFGRRANEFSYNDNGTLAAIKQAYVSYAPSEKMKFTVGKWTTHVGYELLDAYLNRNYSMDYMFSYGPFFHTGLKADITINSNFAFMVGVANPSDMVTASFAKKFILAQLHLSSSNSKLGGYLNYVGGKDPGNNSTIQLDAVITGIITDKFNVGYNGTIKSVKAKGGSDQSWWGSAIYLNYDPLSTFGLTLRGEYFDDSKGIAGFYNKIFDLTLSGNIKVDNLTIIPEFRVDSGKYPLFFKNTGSNGPTGKSTGTFILAATYHF